MSSFEELLPKDSVSASEYARLTALHKAQDVARKLAAEAAAAAGAAAQVPVLVIGADTVVEYGEHILEKPAGRGGASMGGGQAREWEERTQYSAWHVVQWQAQHSPRPTPGAPQMPRTRRAFCACSAGSSITCTRAWRW